MGCPNSMDCRSRGHNNRSSYALSAPNRKHDKENVMTVREIITTWLEENGYDGLTSADKECDCSLKDKDWHIGQCDEMMSCVPAVKRKCDFDCKYYHVDEYCRLGKKECMKLDKEAI